MAKSQRLASPSAALKLFATLLLQAEAEGAADAQSGESGGGEQPHGQEQKPEVMAGQPRAVSL